MKKHLRSIKNIDKEERDINNILPDILFLYSILKKESFIEKIKKEMLSINEISSIFKSFFHAIFLLITSPVWLISEIFDFKYNQSFFSRKFVINCIYNKKIRNHQKKVFNKYSKEIENYNNIVKEDKFFINLENYGYNIVKEEFDLLLIRNEVIIAIDNKIKELYNSYKGNPDNFIEYFNIYVNAKKENNQDLNLITKALNEYILKNSKPEKEEKKNRAKIIIFDKNKS